MRGLYSYLRLSTILIPMGKIQKLVEDSRGFTAIEVIVACVIFPIIVIGLSNAYDSVRHSYTLAKRFNEMYSVLSACPELDRALEFTSLSASANCYPNNSVDVEGGSGRIITYSPVMTVTDTASLPLSDPLKTVPDSKIINIQVSYPRSSAPPLELRMLITRNGIGQL
jgi:prepilin-type N-terminal cleavage/methylation domain-containing protein